MVLPEYDGLLDGGHVESVIGPKWAYSGTNALGGRANGRGSFEAALASYRFQLEHQPASLAQFQPVVYTPEYYRREVCREAVDGEDPPCCASMDEIVERCGCVTDDDCANIHPCQPDGQEPVPCDNDICQGDHVCRESVCVVRLENNKYYQTLRYGLGMALLDNGYFTPNVSDQEDVFRKKDIPVLDEYTRGLAWECPASTKWLGQPVAGPTGAPPTEAYENGVWIREFDHGLVVVNPHITATARDAREVRGPEQIMLPAGNWKIFSGGQDAAHNTGQSLDGAAPFPIDAGDAYLLVRDGSPVPSCP